MDFHANLFTVLRIKFMIKNSIAIVVSAGMLIMGAAYAATPTGANKNNTTAAKNSTAVAPASSDASEDTTNDDTNGSDIDSDSSGDNSEDY
jgi:hypothetical protein